MKKALALFLATLLILALAACGAQPAPEGGDAAPASAGPAAAEEDATGEGKHYTIWSIQSQDFMIDIFNDSIARFEAANPGYTVESLAMSAEDYKQKITVALGSNTAPDIFVTWTGGGMIEYINAGRIIDLTEYMEKDNYRDYFMDAGVGMATYDDKIWAVPVENCSIASLYYNSALFEQYDVELPTNQTELEAVCDVFVENGIVPFGLPNKSKYFGSMYYMYLVDRLAGSELFPDAANHENGASFDDEAFTRAGEIIQDWASKGYFGEGYNGLDGDSGQHRQMLYNNECAMIMDGSWVVSLFKMDEAPNIDDIKVLPFPTIDGGKGDPNALVGTIGDTFYCVNSETEEPEMAFEMIKYLIDDVAVEKRIEAGRLPPTKNTHAEEPLNVEVLELLNKAPSIQLWYDQYLPSAAAEVHKDSLQALFGFDITPEEYNAQMIAAAG